LKSRSRESDILPPTPQTLLQQAKIEIILRGNSVIACSRHIYLCVAIRTHPVHVETHFQHFQQGQLNVCDNIPSYLQ